MTKNRKSEHQLIVQALNAAETNIRLAKQLLSGVKAEPPQPSPKELPGIVGTFDGENMVTKDGKKFAVNPNYASKSVLVYGDTLKRIEVEGKEQFKQIERVKRQKVEGVLAKKDGKWVAVTPDGSYRVSPVAVEFYGGKEDDEVVVVLPLENKNVPYAALESIKKEEKPSGPSKPSVPSKEEKKAPAKGATKKRSAAKKVTKKKVEEKKPAEEKPAEKVEAKPAAKVEPVENDEELR